ncbi:MAG TPA: alpha/beta hydrolase [Kofleriaceae bacterium]|jgi:pimeloyl-ACP methyl ester carboxylesterase|nr:alpha/beta hydrolase [Kofleriaceae bacterium]
MAFITVGTENSADIQLYYEDRGSGKPVVLIHGWPLSGGAWERQSAVLLAAGFRVITYDRRGFGRSSAPEGGYDYDTLSGDLAKIVDALGLRDATLIGFSMGGGEVARYMSRYSGKGIAKCAFVASIAPALRKDGNNPDGVDPAVFEGIKRGIEQDRYAFLTEFLHNFFNKKLLGGSHISSDAIQANWNVAANSSYGAMLKCVDAWLEDFRIDLTSITVPTLVVHGDADQIVPADASGKRVAQFVKQAQTHIIKDAPHGLTWTHATELNKLLLEFVK